MKLLFDENISFRIIKSIQNDFPNSIHVSRIGLKMPVEDKKIWDLAKNNQYTIATFDEDFEDFSSLYGFPPKVVLFRIGNSSTKNLINILYQKKSDIEAFLDSEYYGVFEIY